MEKQDYILEMRDITKQFPGVRALDQVNFKVRRGEIHALTGENGAGKSTLMKILSGYYVKGTYEGSFFINGEECNFKNKQDAERKGIAIIYQESSLAKHLNICENIFLGNEIQKLGVINWEKSHATAHELLKSVMLDADTETKVSELQAYLPGAIYHQDANLRRPAELPEHIPKVRRFPQPSRL